MTRAKISEYSATAADNTDVNGTNIAEGCPPSSMNNMGREIMAALKRFQTGSDGDGVTVGGNLVVSGSATLSSTATLSNVTSATLAAGSASAPTLHAAGDTNTGIFFPAADTIAFAEGGVEAVRIDSSGNVGIGTSSPGSYSSSANNLVVYEAGAGGITIASNTTGAGSLFFADGTTGNEAYRGYVQYAHTIDALLLATAGTDRLVIDSSGNVGIGTTTPLGTAANRTVATVNGTSSAIVSLGVGGTRIGSYYADATKLILGTNTSTFLEFDTNGTERARITAGGFFKASNDGSYVGSTSSNHEFKNTATATCVQFSSTNASFAQNILIADATPSASSSYVFLLCRSAVNADVEFNLRGDGNAYADGTWNNNGADYAEYFESANGQALTLGATVVLDGNKVREATDQDPSSAIIGVVRPKEPSKASMVVGNTAWNKWANKYLTDDFDRYIMEDHDVVEWEEQVLENEATEAIEAVVDEGGNEVSPAIPAQEATYKTINHSYESHNIPEGITVPEDATVKTHDEKGNKFQHYKLNPAWDKDSEYTPREQRPEWNIIGLVGQVKVLKGQPTNDRWVKMRDVSDTVEEWFIR